MSVIHVTDSDFEQQVLKADKPVLLDFWATWCGPCKQISPILDEIAAQRDDIIIAKMNIDENQAVPVKFGVRSIPTLLIFNKGESIATTMGSKPKNQLISWIDGAIASLAA